MADVARSVAFGSSTAASRRPARRSRLRFAQNRSPPDQGGSQRDDVAGGGHGAGAKSAYAGPSLSRSANLVLSKCATNGDQSLVLVGRIEWSQTRGPSPLSICQKTQPLRLSFTLGL